MTLTFAQRKNSRICTFPPGKAKAQSTQNNLVWDAKLRLLGSEAKHLDFKQSCLSYSFLAGLIDGDGHFVIYKHTGALEIAGSLSDRPLFEQLLDRFGGSIGQTTRLGIRYRLNSRNSKKGRATFIELVEGLNGHVRNTLRVAQFKKLCKVLSIVYKPSGALTMEDGYIAGFFCADGTITMNAISSRAKNIPTFLTRKASGKIVKKASDTKALTNTAFYVDQKVTSKQRMLSGVAHSISISISNKYLVNIEGFGIALHLLAAKKNAGGEASQLQLLRNSSKVMDKDPKISNTHYVKRLGGSYRFTIDKKEAVLLFLDYMNKHRSHSIKHKRLDLIKKFYALKKNLYRADKSMSKEWVDLLHQWFDIGDTSTSC
jgi:hypothetical protein